MWGHLDIMGEGCTFPTPLHMGGGGGGYSFIFFLPQPPSQGENQQIFTLIVGFPIW